MWDEVRTQTLAPQTVYASFGLSLVRLAVGLGLGIAIGVPIGILMGLYKWADALFHDFVVSGLAMPSLVWALLLGMWVGFGSTAPIVTVMLVAAPFVIMNTAEGVRAVPKDLLDMGRAYSVNRRKAILHIVFPSLMPFFFASLRYALANGWKGVVLAEVFASTDGAGWMIKYWYDAGRGQGIMGYALFFVLFAIVLDRLVFGRLYGLVFRWRPQAGARPEPARVRGEQFQLETVHAGTDGGTAGAVRRGGK